MEPLVSLTERGLYCAAGDFYVAPGMPPGATTPRAGGPVTRTANHEL